MNQSERNQIMTQQLDNVVKLLDGELVHQTLVDSRGNIQYRYIITYTK